MALMVFNDTWIERCDHSRVTACPQPRVEWLHGHTPEPDSPLRKARPAYVLSTATGITGTITTASAQRTGTSDT